MQAWKADGSYVGLRSLLDVIETNDWSWHLEEFDGMTEVAVGVDALKLENRLIGGELVALTWDELVVFAEKVHQLIDGRIAAFMPGEVEPVLILEAVDSTYWKCTAREGDVRATAALDRAAALSH